MLVVFGVSVGLAVMPLNYLRAALALVALRGIGFFGARPPSPAATARLDPVRFGILWPIMFLLVVSGLVILSWLGFALWLTPWHRVPWF